jgi:dihydroflavonol-4-reductase
MSSAIRVVVTGASGFLGKHIVLALMQAGHSVRASVRNPAMAEQVRHAVLPNVNRNASDRLQFVTLDLTHDEGWAEAMGGASALVHTASPFPIAPPKNPDDLVRPAVDGTRRALCAAKTAGVSRVILTSSAIAVIQPWRRDGHIFTEDDWSDATGLPTQPYARAKVIAERAAWEIAAREKLRLTVLNPAFILGPLLDDRFGASVQLVRRILCGRDPMLPRLGLSVVDVRDVATAHLRALEREDTEGQRFILASGSLWLTDWGKILKTIYPRRRMPTRAAPLPILRLLALFDGEIRTAMPSVGHIDELCSDKARRHLGIDFIPPDRALIAAAEALVSRGLV